MGEMIREAITTGRTEPRIATERLNLRPVQESDAEDIYDMRSRPAIMKWSSTGVPDTDISLTKDLLRKWNDPTGIAFVAQAKDDPMKRVCSLIGFKPSHIREGIELGYMMHPDVWGKGYATEAVQACIDEWWKGFPGVQVPDHMLNALYAVTTSGNKSSYRVLEKCGFVVIEHLEDAELWELRRPAGTNCTATA